MASMVRPDFSQYVVHFTTDRKPCCSQKHPLNGCVKKASSLGALERLVSILQSGELWATPMPWTNTPAVCLTECTWVSLLDHAGKYSPFGVGFTKSFIFQNGGGPAIYLRADHYNAQNDAGGFDAAIQPFITPFWPFYAPLAHKKRFYGTSPGVDYSHEREWRVAQTLKFTPKDVQFVIMKDYKAMAKFPQALKDAIGRDKFILMDQYKLVERIWPTHIVQS